jgi:hypothetical protein
MRMIRYETAPQHPHHSPLDPQAMAPCMLMRMHFPPNLLMAKGSRNYQLATNCR